MPSVPSWLQRSTSLLGLEQDRTLIVAGGLIGLITGLATVAFSVAVTWLEHLSVDFQARHAVWLLPALPMAGALVTALLIRYGASDAQGHGVPQVLDAIIRRGGLIPARVGVVKALASIATVGSGGSAGVEGPIVQIGSTAGSVFGRLARFKRQHMGTLVGCGAAAGIASIFNAPIAGVFFVLEVLLRDFSLRTFAPVVIASVLSTAVTQSALPRLTSLLHVPLERGSGGAIFPVFSLWNFRFTLAEIPSYVGLGVVCALVAVGFTKLLHAAEDRFERLGLPSLLKPVLGALLLGLLGIAFVLAVRPAGQINVPPFFGNGYDTIRLLLDADSYVPPLPDAASVPHNPIPLSAILLVALVACKALGTTFTLASGGSGGVFAPSLFLGAAAGGAFGVLLDRAGLLPAGASPAAYALVGMAAVVAGTTFAPLTGILLLFELTREPSVLLPAMLAATICATTSRVWMRDSIYTAKLRRAGVITGTAIDLSLLRRVPVSTVPLVPLPREPVYAADPLSKLLTLHATHHVPDFVVIDTNGRYIGMVTGADMRTALIDREAIPLLLVAELLRTDLPTIHPDEHLDSVVDKFARHDVASLPLVSAEGVKRPLGLITRSAVMKRYRHALEEA